MSDNFRMKENDYEKAESESANILMSILNGVNAYICVTVPETGEVLYLNDRIRDIFGVKGSGAGEFCYKLFFGNNERCAFCPYCELEKEPDKVIEWEQKGVVGQRTHRKTAMIIDWSGGKKAHLEYGFDVTNFIQAQEAIEQSRKMLNAHKNIAVSFLQDDKPFEEIMGTGIKIIADAVDLDRFSIYRRRTASDGSHALLVYLWDKNQIDPDKSVLSIKDIPYSKYAPEWDAIFERGECINGPVSVINSGVFLKTYKIVSVFMSPIFIYGEFWGIAVFQDCHKETTYDKEQADMMKSVAHLCANTIIREQMKIEISSQNDFNRTLLKTVPVGSVIYDEDFNFTECNEYMSAMLGVSKEYYLKHFNELMPEYQPSGAKSADKVREIMTRTLLGGEIVRENWVQTTVDGEPVPCEVTSVPIKNKNRTLGIAYVYDLRSIKKLERSVIEAEERIKLVLDTSPTSCTLWDSEFNVTDCNEAAVKLFEAGSKEDIIHNFLRLSPKYQPDGQLSRDKLASHYKKALTDGRSKFDWTNILPDGTYLPTEKIFARFDYKDDYIIVGYTFDMREYKRMISEIEGALYKSQEASRAKSEFLSRMSHEMLTPMNAIMGMTQLLKLQTGTAKAAEYVKEIDNAAQELLRMINDVLDMSNMEFDIFKLENAPFSFVEMFDGIIKVMNNFITQKQQIFTYDIDETIPRRLIGDEKRLAQVISNILANAVKFTPEHGRVSFRASVDGADSENIFLRVKIADNGIGMSKEQQRNIFDLFEQVDGSNARHYGGIGMGLVFSKRIIEMMGGDITVESESGKGSKFIFTCKIKML